MIHTHFHSYVVTNKNAKRLLLAFGVTVTFMLIEISASLVSGSLVLLADAGHMLIDAAALLFAMLAVCFANRPPNARYTFGWLRLTTLVAFANAIALVVITLLIILEALKRFHHPHSVSEVTMITIAITGLISNLVVFWILHHGLEKKDLNVRAAALHVIGDLLGSIAAISAGLMIHYLDCTSIDSIVSLLVSCLVLRSTWTLLKESVNELLEGAPVSLDILALKHSLCHSIPAIRNVHHIHVWQVGEKPIMTLHVQVISVPNHDALLENIQHFLEQQYKISHATIQLEYQNCSGQDCYINELQPSCSPV